MPALPGGSWTQRPGHNSLDAPTWFRQTRIKTPNIDKLAAEGIRFTDFYAGSTVCAPSRCALMAGLHTGHALVRGNSDLSLRPEDITVAELLKQAGYYTGLLGKWG